MTKRITKHFVKISKYRQNKYVHCEVYILSIYEHCYNIERLDKQYIYIFTYIYIHTHTHTHTHTHMYIYGRPERTDLTKLQF